jgi:hypothetical protein
VLRERQIEACLFRAPDRQQAGMNPEEKSRQGKLGLIMTKLRLGNRRSWNAILACSA